MKTIKHMFILISIILFGVGNAFAQKERDSDPLAHIGIWELSDEGEKLTLFVNNDFHWEHKKDCEKPPCDVELTSGKFMARGDKIYLHPDLGEETVLTFKVMEDQKYLILNENEGVTLEYEYTGSVIR